MLQQAGSRLRSALRQAARKRWSRDTNPASPTPLPSSPSSAADPCLPSASLAPSGQSLFTSAATRDTRGVPLIRQHPATHLRHWSSAVSGGRKAEPHIPGFLETLGKDLGSEDGQIFVVTALFLASAAFLGERLLSDSSHGQGHSHTHEHEAGHGKGEDEPAEGGGVEVLEVVVPEEPEEKPTLLEAAAEASVGAAEVAVGTLDTVGEAVTAAVEVAVDAVGEAAEAVTAAVDAVAAAVEGKSEGEKGEESAAGVPEGEVDAVVAVAVPAVEAAGETEQESAGEKADCPFCKFMRAGPCGAQFSAWEACVDSADKEEMVEKCMEATHQLKVCMEEHGEYYGVILEAEKSLLDREIQEEQGEGASGEGGVENEAVVVVEEVVVEGDGSTAESSGSQEGEAKDSESGASASQS